MIIRSIVLNNFGIYAGHQTISLAAKDTHNNRTVTLVGGRNGRGKTSILEAVLLALYGNRSPRVQVNRQSYSSYLLEFMHKRGGLEPKSSVEMDFDVPDRNRYVNIRVKRSWQLRKVRVTDRLQVWRDGHEDKYLAEHWDTFVEGLIPSGIAELFFFDGEKILSLAESEETVEPLQKAIHSLLGIEVVDRLIKDLNIIILRKKNELQDDSLKQAIDEIQQKAKQLQAQKDQLIQSRANLNNQLKIIQKKLDALEEQYHAGGGELFKNRRRLEERKEQLKEKINNYKITLATQAAGALPLAILREQLIRLRQSCEKDIHIFQAKTALPVLDNLIREIREQMNRLENRDELTSLDRMLQDKWVHLKTLATNHQTFPSVYSLAKQIDALLNEVLDFESRQALEVMQKYQAAELELEQLEKSLFIDIDHEHLNRIITERAKLEVQADQIAQKIQSIEKEIAGVNRELQLMEANLTKIGLRLAELDDAKRVIKYASKVQENMRLFRKRMIEKKIDKLAAHITKAFHILAHKKSLVSHIHIEPETLKISLYDTRGQTITKSRLSNGERQMLALAILWGLGQASERALPVIIDTPMGRLDSLHRKNFVEKYLPNASHQVMVLSTDTEIDGRYYPLLEKFVGEKYRLHFDEETQATQIVSGYFEPHELKTHEPNQTEYQWELKR